MRSRLCGSDMASLSPVMTTWGSDRKGGLSRSGETKQYQLCCIHTEVSEEHQRRPEPLSQGSVQASSHPAAGPVRDVRES